MADKYKLTNYFVFNGGITGQGYELLKCHGPLQDIAVFAGALEPYNGIDRLIDFWLKHSPNIELHVFGRGSLAAKVQLAAEQDGKVQYHGFQSADEITEWQKTAKFNFCLRFSDGIDEELFFPSKFFNAACAPGLLIINEFQNLPSYMRDQIGVWNNDSDLVRVLACGELELLETSRRRRERVFLGSSWVEVARKMCFKIDSCD